MNLRTEADSQCIMSVNSLSDIKVSKHHIPAWHSIPNTSIQNKPLLIYHSAFKRDVSVSRVSAHLNNIGVVLPQWQYTMYSQSHFHSTTHEVLSVVSGSARLCFGGEENPQRVETVVTTGDVIVVPAGVAHRLLEDQSGTSTAHGDGAGFSMLGSYPKASQDWDMCYGTPDEDEQKVKERISQLRWLDQDPIYGLDGPAIHV